MSDPKRILVVDDEPVVVQLLAEGLSRSGNQYIVETALTGEEAINKITQIEYNLVITDYKMPGTNGLELARIIRRKSPKTRVVMMSAYGSENLRNETEQMQLDGFLDKPVSIHRVRQIVQKAVGETTKVENALWTKKQHSSTDLQEYLVGLKVKTSARCVLLLSAGGHLIEMAGTGNNLDIPNISTLVAANFLAAAELARLVGNNSVFKSSHHEGPNYDIYAQDLNGECFLAVIFGPESKTGIVRFYTNSTVETMKPLLDIYDFQDSELNMNISDEVGSQLDEIFENDSLHSGVMTLNEAIEKGIIPARAREIGI